MSFYNALLNVLKCDERFFTDDGQLLRNAVYEVAMQMDAKLIKALFDHEQTRKRFLRMLMALLFLIRLVLVG